MIKYIKADVIIPLITWNKHLMLDGYFNMSFDVFTYLLDQKIADVKVAFFIHHGVDLGKLEQSLKFLFDLKYGSWDLYKHRITYISNSDTLFLDTPLLYCLHAKVFTQICEFMDIAKNKKPINILIGKRYTNADFKTLMDNKYFNKNWDYFLTIAKDEHYIDNRFKQIISYDIPTYYKMFHKFKEPDNECWLVNISYSKYIKMKQHIDDFVKDKPDLLWLMNPEDQKAKLSPYYSYMTSEKVMDVYNHFTHYSYMEPTYQSGNCRIISESLYLGKHVEMNRVKELTDDALYRFNMGVYDKFYFDIESSGLKEIIGNLI